MNDPFHSAESEDLDDLLGATSLSEDLQDLLRTTTESQDLSELLAPSYSMSEANLRVQQQQQLNAQPRTVPEETVQDEDDDGFLSESLASFVRQVETTLEVSHEGFLQTTTSAAATIGEIALPSPLPPRKAPTSNNINNNNGLHQEEEDDDDSPPMLVDEDDDDPEAIHQHRHEDQQQDLLISPGATVGLSEEEEALRRAELAVLKRYDSNNSNSHSGNSSSKDDDMPEEDTEILFSPDLATPPPNPHYNLTRLTEAKRLAMQGQTEEEEQQQAFNDNVPMAVSTPMTSKFAAFLEMAAGAVSAAVMAGDGELMEMAESPLRIRSVEDEGQDKREIMELVASAIENNDRSTGQDKTRQDPPGAMAESKPSASAGKSSINDVPKSQPNPTNVPAAMISPAGSSFPDTLAFRRSPMCDETTEERQSSAVARKQSKPPLTVDTSSAVVDGAGHPPTTLAPPHSSIARSSPRSQGENGSSPGSVASEVDYVGEVDEASYDEEVKRKTPKGAATASVPTSAKAASPAKKSPASLTSPPAPASEKTYTPHQVATSTTTLSPTQGFSKRQPSPALAAARAAARGAVTTLKNSVTGMVPKKVASVAPAPSLVPSPPRTTTAKETAKKPTSKPAPVQSPKRSPTATIVSASSRLLRDTAASSAHLKQGHAQQHTESPKRSPTAPVVSASSRLLQGTAATSAHTQPIEPQTSPRTRTRERLRQRLQKQKDKPESEKTKSNFSSEEGIHRARERIRLRHLELQKAEKENEIRKSRAAAAARVKSSRPVTVPKAPRLSTTARFPDRNSLPGQGAKTVGRREPTVPQSPKFATKERHGSKKLGKVMDTSVTLASRKGLRSDDLSGGSNGSRKGPTIPQSPKFATTERHGRKIVAMHDPPPLALSSDILSKGLRENKPGPQLSKKRDYTLTVPHSPKFHHVKKREAPKSKAEEEKEIMDYYKAHPFKAQPVMMNDPVKPAGYQKPPRVITVPAPFHLRTDDRAILHKHTDESDCSEKSAKGTRQFHARPMPNFSRPGLNPAASTVPGMKPPTNPRPFRLSTGTRAIQSKRSSSPEASKPKPFKARPLPKTTFTPSPSKISSSVSSMEKYSHITPPHLETAARSEIRQATAEKFNMHAEEFIKKKEIEAKIRQRERQIEELVKSDKKSGGNDIHEELKGMDNDHARITQFRARPYQASPPHTIKPRTARKPTTPEPFQLSTSAAKHHPHEEEERIRAEQEEEELQRKADFKARPVPQTQYKYNPISPNATGVPFHIANAARQMAEEEKKKADDERRKFKARPVPMSTYTPKPILSPTTRPPPSEVTIPQPIFSPELALKQRAHESMAMDAYAAEQERLQAEAAGRDALE